jgi:hypothetical protein
MTPMRASTSPDPGATPTECVAQNEAERTVSPSVRLDRVSADRITTSNLSVKPDQAQHII